MTVYLGDSGYIEIGRTTDGNYVFGDIDPADVNARVNRFSFSYRNNEFNTGDLLEFTVLDASGAISKANIDFVDPAGFPDGKASPQSEWYVNADAQRGLRLYSTQAEAIDGETTNAIPLKVPAAKQQVRVRLMNNDFKCLGQLQAYELNTDRDVVDTTVLGDAFRQRVSGLISGSGVLTAFWDYKMFNDCCDVEYDMEVSNYLHQLVLRQEQGAIFRALFYLKRPEEGCESKAVYYETDAMVSSVALAFAPGGTVTSRINFVTTGEVKLKMKPVPAPFNLLNQTGGSYQLQNNAGNLALKSP